MTNHKKEVLKRLATALKPLYPTREDCLRSVGYLSGKLSRVQLLSYLHKVESFNDTFWRD